MRLAVLLRFFAVGVVCALSGPVCAGMYAEPSQRAAAWLETQQDVSDGSWRDPNDLSTSSTFLQTSEAVLALYQVNRRNAAYYSGQTWIENHDPQNTDLRARRVVALSDAQSNANSDINALLNGISYPLSEQNGWGLAGRYQASPLDTALVLDALVNKGAPFNSAIAIAYLKATQRNLLNDKGWPSASESASDPFTTARVVQALASFLATDATLATPLANAIATLKVNVTTASAPHVRAAAALAYLRMDINSADAKILLDSLVQSQRADGGFDAGIFATAMIVQAFAAAEGADAVSSRQRVAIPDVSLRKEINLTLGRGALDQLNRGELSQLTTLDISGKGVTSLVGLEYATNLTSLNLANNAVTSLASLSNLQRLTQVDLSGNPGIVRTNTTTTLVSGQNPANKATPVMLTATVTGARPQGIVRFLDGTTVVGTKELTGDDPAVTATQSTFSQGVTLPGGFRHVVAMYDGDVDNAPSSSAPLSQMMNPDAAGILMSIINSLLLD